MVMSTKLRKTEAGTHNYNQNETPGSLSRDDRKKTYQLDRTWQNEVSKLLLAIG